MSKRYTAQDFIAATLEEAGERRGQARKRARCIVGTANWILKVIDWILDKKDDDDNGDDPDDPPPPPGDFNPGGPPRCG